MRVLDIINEINVLYKDIDRNTNATEQILKDTEFYIGKSLPKSYKTFLKYFSNGIFLYDVEPILGAGKDYKETPCGIVRLSAEILPFDKPSCIVGENRLIDRKRFSITNLLNKVHRKGRVFSFHRF